jgi:hypothetical protein
MRQAGQIMGIFLARANDYTPENQMTLEDVAKAYLKVDKEFFGSCYHARAGGRVHAARTFQRRLGAGMEAHEAAIPQLYLLPQWGDDQVEQVLQANLDKLGLGPDFGLELQSVRRLNSTRPAQTIVACATRRGAWRKRKAAQ